MHDVSMATPKTAGAGSQANGGKEEENTFLSPFGGVQHCPQSSDEWNLKRKFNRALLCWSDNCTEHLQQAHFHFIFFMWSFY